MGETGRAYMEERFDRNIVVRRYLDAIATMTENTNGGKRK